VAPACRRHRPLARPVRHVVGQLPTAPAWALIRLGYADSATNWGFAIYRASYDDYDKALLPRGYPAGTP
jgi:hypothetical protein